MRDQTALFIIKESYIVCCNKTTFAKTNMITLERFFWMHSSLVKTTVMFFGQHHGETMQAKKIMYNGSR